MIKNGIVEIKEIKSRLLKSTRLGGGDQRKFPVILPPHYYQEPQKKYPLIVYCIGYGGSYEIFFNEEGRFQEKRTLEEDCEAIVVIPNCFTLLGGSKYINSPAMGNHEDYIIKEVIPYVEKNYRTNGIRACVGGSSGGIGSFHLVGKYPGFFQALACFSPDVGFPTIYQKNAQDYIRGMKNFSFEPQKFLKEVLKKDFPLKDYLDICYIFCVAAFYTPSPHSPLGFSIPIDSYTGEFDEEIFNQWCIHDPLNNVEKYAASFRKLKYFYLDCGDEDQFLIFPGTRKLHKLLEKHQIKHDYNDYHGDHFKRRGEMMKKTLPHLVKKITSCEENYA